MCSGIWGNGFHSLFFYVKFLVGLYKCLIKTILKVSLGISVHVFKKDGRMSLNVISVYVRE